jgi:putative SOS response-associated peptidase YedK
MCGRVRLSSDVSEIKLVFSNPPERPTPNFTPSWNVAPTDSLPVVRYDTKAGQRSLDMLRWGLIPYWANDIKVGFANINTKAEGIESKPAFRDGFQRRRCLVPADFYEWKKTANGKQPYALALADRGTALISHLVSGTSGKRPRSSEIDAVPLVHQHSTGQPCSPPDLTNYSGWNSPRAAATVHDPYNSVLVVARVSKYPDLSSFRFYQTLLLTC